MESVDAASSDWGTLLAEQQQDNAPVDSGSSDWDMVLAEQQQDSAVDAEIRLGIGVAESQALVDRLVLPCKQPPSEVVEAVELLLPPLHKSFQLLHFSFVEISGEYKQ